MSHGALYGYPAERLAHLTGSHLATARRWKRSLRAPRWLLRMVAVFIEGELEEIDPAWRGWKIRAGELISPENQTFTPGAVRAGEIYRIQVCEFNRQTKALAATVDSNQERRARLEQLTAMQAALHAAGQAFESLTGGLTPRELGRLFALHPATQKRVARNERAARELSALRAPPSSSP